MVFGKQKVKKLVYPENELRDPLAFDRTLREIFQILPKRFIELLLGEKITEVLPTALPSVKDRTVDFLGKLSNGKIIQIEIQSVYDPELPMRLLDTYVRIYEKYKDYPMQMILWIGDGKCPYGKSLRVGEIKLKALVRDIKKISCDTLLESDDPLDNLMAVLCKEVSNFWDRLKEKVLKWPEERRGDYLVKLFHLARLRKRYVIRCREFIEEVAPMPIKIEVEKDPLYKEGLRKGVKRGLQQGLRRGLQRGLKQGLILDAQEMVIEALEEKFGEVGEEMKERIRSIQDRNFLKKLHRLVIRAGSLEEVEKTYLSQT